MREVTKAEFFAFINPREHIETAVVGKYPYRWEVKQNGQLIAHEEGEKWFLDN